MKVNLQGSALHLSVEELKVIQYSLKTAKHLVHPKEVTVLVGTDQETINQIERTVQREIESFDPKKGKEILLDAPLSHLIAINNSINLWLNCFSIEHLQQPQFELKEADQLLTSLGKFIDAEVLRKKKNERRLILSLGTDDIQASFFWKELGLSPSYIGLFVSINCNNKENERIELHRTKVMQIKCLEIVKFCDSFLFRKKDSFQDYKENDFDFLKLFSLRIEPHKFDTIDNRGVDVSLEFSRQQAKLLDDRGLKVKDSVENLEEFCRQLKLFAESSLRKMGSVAKTEW